MSNDVAKSSPIFDDETLGNIRSFEDALAVLSDAGVQVTDISDYGDGFAVVRKEELVNAPFVIVDYKFADGDFGTPFAILRVVTKDGRKAIFTDGSTGVRAQMQDLDKRGISGGVLVKNGLTVSEYEYIDAEGNKTPAKTFYLAQ